jgi:hypothetical protein
MHLPAGRRQSVERLATGWTTEGSEFESWYSQEYSLLHVVVQAGSGVHPTSYPMDTGAVSSGVKRPGPKAADSLVTYAEVTKMWICTPTPPYAFKA